MNWNQTILYEQPVNELTRVCLRLEQLFKQIQHCFQNDNPWDSREVLHAMLEVITVMDRPDLKSQLAKELTRYQGDLKRLEQISTIDHSQLRKVLVELDVAITALNRLSGKFAQTLRTNEFLNSIRLQLSNPGGSCSVNTPALNYWIYQPYAKRSQQLAEWLNQIDPIRKVINLILRLIRESNIAEIKHAQQGFYETALDAKNPCQLVRIELPHDANVYPEFSGSRHRLCIRFLTFDHNGRDTQTHRDLTFRLTCCIL